MIEQADRLIEKWVLSVMERSQSQAAVLFDPSRDVAKPPFVGVHLFEVQPGNRVVKAKKARTQLTLKYWVTVSHESATEAHRLLGELLLSALDPELMPGLPPGLEVESSPREQASWHASGLPPAGFVIRLPVLHDRPIQQAPPVMLPIDLLARPVTRLRGRVLGPADEPIVGTEVELPMLGKTVRTDGRGGFVFEALPQHEKGASLRFRVRGHDQVIAATHGQPVTIRINPLES